MEKNKALLEELKIEEKDIYDFNPGLDYGELVLKAIKFLELNNSKIEVI